VTDLPNKGLGSASLEKMLGPVDFKGKETQGLLGEADFFWAAGG
jgi:hypothetical protein